jgi:nitroreductase
MEVYEAVRTVLAVREFQSKPVPDSVVHRVIESARLTGSSQNGQPWDFVVVQNRETLVKLGSIVGQWGRYNAQAAFAVAVAIDRSSPFGVSDASRAIQSMVLTAWSEGIGSNWTGWVGLTEVASLLGVPESLDVIAVVPFGYPAQVRTRGKKRRKNLSEIAHRERFGQPFS